MSETNDLFGMRYLDILNGEKPETDSRQNYLSKIYLSYNNELINCLKSKYRKSSHEAADIFHQAFIQFIVKTKESQVNNPRAFLYKTIKNLVIDSSRHQKVRSDYLRVETEGLSELDFRVNLPEKIAMSDDQLEKLKGIIKELPRKQRRALILHRIHQMSYKEVAKDMGISTEAARKNVLRALSFCQSKVALISGDL